MCENLESSLKGFVWLGIVKGRREKNKTIVFIFPVFLLMTSGVCGVSMVPWEEYWSLCCCCKQLPGDKALRWRCKYCSLFSQHCVHFISIAFFFYRLYSCSQFHYLFPVFILQVHHLMKWNLTNQQTMSCFLYTIFLLQQQFFLSPSSHAVHSGVQFQFSCGLVG